MRGFNIKVGDTRRQLKVVYDLYKDSLDNIIDNNIYDIVAKIVYTKSGPLKQGISITQPCIPQDINVL